MTIETHTLLKQIDLEPSYQKENYKEFKQVGVY